MSKAKAKFEILSNFYRSSPQNMSLWSDMGLLLLVFGLIATFGVRPNFGTRLSDLISMCY